MRKATPARHQMIPNNSETGHDSMVDQQRLIDRLLFAICVWALPVSLGLAYLVGIFTWDFQSGDVGKRPLDFRVVEDAPAILGPSQALEQLAAAPLVAGRDTKLSEAPFWFSFTVPPFASGEPVKIELPSRHGREVTCWDVPALNSLGSANRSYSTGQIRSVKGGFAIGLGSLQSIARVMCREISSGPAHISVVAWPESTLETSAREFSFEAGVLEGSIALLGAYMLIMALRTRNSAYLLCAMCSVALVQLSAVTAGMDHQWLASVLSPDLVFFLRPYIIASLYATTFALLGRLFIDDQEPIPRLLSITDWIGISLLVGAVILPYRTFLLCLWVATVFGNFTQIVLLGQELVNRPSLAWIWFVAAIGISVVFFFYNIVASTFGVTGTFGDLNVVVAATLSVLFLTLAVAERVREENRYFVKTRREICAGYEALPVGLFSFDAAGRVTHANRAFSEMTRTQGSGDQRFHCNDCFEPGSWEQLQSEVPRTGEHEFELRKTSANGEQTRFLVTASRSDKSINGFVEDITEKTMLTGSVLENFERKRALDYL
jgi:PAS domain-containing protein